MAFKRVSNPPNPWQRYGVEWLGAPPEAGLEIYEEHARSILSQNDSPDLGFRFSLNPYRGCFHACAYCYARPTHQYLEFGAGTDFDRKLIAKVNAPELLEEAFRKKSWQGECVVFSGVTDCYQPLEATYELTRRCLEVALAFRNPVSLITKSALVRRDVQLFSQLHTHARVHVTLSIAFSDDKMARLIEPNAPLPSARFEALKALSAAGVPTGVAVAPLIPGLNDAQIAEVLERAQACGARNAFCTMLRLPAEVEPVFIERLHVAFPDRAQKVLNGIRDMRGGELYKGGFGERMRGEGERWRASQWLFENTCKRLGLNSMGEQRLGREPGLNDRETFKRPPKRGETASLFE